MEIAIDLLFCIAM